MIHDAADFPGGVQPYSLTVLSLIKVPLLTLAGLVLVLASLLLVLPATRRRAGLRWLAYALIAPAPPPSSSWH